MSDVGYTSLLINTVDTYVRVQRKMYVVLSTVTHQDRSGQFTTILRLLEVDDNGDDVGKPAIEVNTDIYDVAVI